jgi:hypothetical protein
MRGSTISIAALAFSATIVALSSVGGCALDRAGLHPAVASANTSSASATSASGGQGGVGGANNGGAAGAGANAPEPCETADCLLWLRADLGIVRVGGSVAQWSDQSGNNHHAVQMTRNNQPTFAGAAVAGRDAVDFTPAQSTWMDLSSLTSNQTNYTIVAVVNQRNTVGIQDLLSSYGGMDLAIAAVTPGGNVGGLLGAMWLEPNVPSMPGVQALVWSVEDSANVLNCYRNNALVGSAPYNASATVGAGSATLGKYRSGLQQHFDGLLAELILYDSTLSDSQRGQVWQYLKARYGL